MYQAMLVDTFHFIPVDDPYYCGLRARIPNFVKRKKKSSDSSGSSKLSSKMPSMTTSSSLINLGKAPQPQQHQQQQMASHHPFWWHSRLYSDNSGQFSKFEKISFVAVAISCTNDAVPPLQALVHMPQAMVLQTIIPEFTL